MREALQLQRAGWVIHNCRVQRPLSNMGSTAWIPSWRTASLTFQNKHGIPCNHPWDTCTLSTQEYPPNGETERDKERKDHVSHGDTWLVAVLQKSSGDYSRWQIECESAMFCCYEKGILQIRMHKQGYCFYSMSKTFSSLLSIVETWLYPALDTVLKV